tara:strand:- start:167 stop:601 length:435 start_codon:yes stop_codon:yes gene_type:complete
MTKLFSIVLISLLIFSCADDNSTESTVDPLVGVWTFVSLEISSDSITTTINSSDDQNEIVIMNEDNTMSVTGTSSGVSFTGSGTWSKNENYLIWNITLISSGQVYTSYTSILEYSISGNTFTGIAVDTIDGVEITTITTTYTKG